MAVFFSVVSKMVSNIDIFQGIVSKLVIPVSWQHYCDVSLCCINLIMINKIVFYYYSLFTSLYSTIYWAVFKQKYDDRERTYTVRLRVIYNGHNARLMHDHVTVISYTLITKLAHPNLCVLVWRWLLLSSESSSLCIMFSYSGFEPLFSLYSQRHENRISPPKHRIRSEVNTIYYPWSKW